MRHRCALSSLAALFALQLGGCGCGPEPDPPPATDPVATDPNLICPLADGVKPRQLDLEVSELEQLEGHGQHLRFTTDTPVQATVFFAPADRDDPCELALSTGQVGTEHQLDLTNLRLGTRYQAVIGTLDEQGRRGRSQRFELETSAPQQTLPGNYTRLAVPEGEVHFDTTIYGEVPANLVMVMGLNLCTEDYGAPTSGNQALLLDAEGYLLGNYVTAGLVTGFSQVHTTVSGVPDYLHGNRNVRVHIGAGVPENTHQATVDLLYGVDEHALQPPVSASNYSFNYVHWLLEDTTALERMGLSFQGQAHLNVISRATQEQTFTEVIIWDDALVTHDNQDDPSAWSVWTYATEQLHRHDKFSTYVNSVAYDPVRNEVVMHTHNRSGGFVWGVNVASRELVWVLGAHARELSGYVDQDTVIISSFEDEGGCEEPFFARAHHVTARHDEGDSADWFYLTLHDNGGDKDGRRLHTRAIEYRMHVDHARRQGHAMVHWAYPANPLPEDDPLHEVLSYHNYTYGSLLPLPEHPDLYLMASGNGYCERETSDEGFPTQEIVVLLRAKPGEHTAEVLATYQPGSDDFPFVNMYTAFPTALYAQVGQPTLTSGRASFFASALEPDDDTGQPDTGTGPDTGTEPDTGQAPVGARAGARGPSAR